MARRLPPLNALRAFEAAARHLSFTKAAEELHVTQAAVSHQVKQLEETLGVVLFRRLNRTILLTDAGQAYLPPLREAFDAIATATAEVTARRETGPLRVSVLPSFAAKWLLPRLPRFREAHPECDLLLSASNEVADLHREGIDAAIRFGLGPYPDLEVTPLMREHVFPVCSPRLLEGPRPLRVPEDLKHHVLLQDQVHDTPDDPGWRVWLDAAGVTGIDPARGPGYSDSALVLQAAVDGQGVALSRRSLAQDDLAAGRLIKPFGPDLVSGFSYRFVTTRAGARDPRIRAFRDWLVAQVRMEEAEEEAPEGRLPSGQPIRKTLESS